MSRKRGAPSRHGRRTTPSYLRRRERHEGRALLSDVYKGRKTEQQLLIQAPCGLEKRRRRMRAWTVKGLARFLSLSLGLEAQNITFSLRQTTSVVDGKRLSKRGRIYIVHSPVAGYGVLRRDQLKVGQSQGWRPVSVHRCLTSRLLRCDLRSYFRHLNAQ